MTPSRRSLTIFLVATVLASAPACQVLGSTVTDKIERSFALGDGGSVTVSTKNGSIRFSGTDGDQVRLVATKRARTRDNLDLIEIQIKDSPERIDVETMVPFRVSNASVSYELEVPFGTRIEATTKNGSIRITGTSGLARAKTVNGSVKVTDFAGGVAAETVNGSVNVAWAKVQDQAKTTLKTVNGSIETRFPSDVSGSFNARTVNGSIKTDLPLEVSKGRPGRQSSVDDRIGDGKSEFQFSTVNGSIRILGG